jgi:hypothetical protein
MHKKCLPIPPRDQWEGNGGYCGETALISAGLYYGQYVSQYDARAFASDDMDQSKSASQLLLGPHKNDRHAARKMHLTSQEWGAEAETCTHDFLAWVKRHILNDVPVAIGVYMNKSVFGDDSDNDPEYDHIVPVIGMESSHPFSDHGYYDDDVIIFSDNGVYTPDSAPVPYIFKYSFGDFQKSRCDANQASAGVYSLALATPDVKNYGIALTGIRTDGSTLRVQVSTDVNYERPGIADGCGERPAAMRLRLSVAVSGLESGALYKMYRYDSMDRVPNRAFNKHASDALRTWDIRGDTTGTFQIDEEVLSDEVVVYRAVPASAS